MPHTLRRAELIATLSYALDLTEGQPRGHSMRVCWIGMQLGRSLGLGQQQLSDLYYTLLLKDLGCSSNAARICQLYLADDHTFKADFKLIDGSLSQALRFVLSHTGLRSGLTERFSAILNIMQNGGEIARELIEARCHRGADIARLMGFSEAVADGILNLDEHWNGRGKPEGRAAGAIPQASQIALMSQVADVFFTASGRDAALREIGRRSGTWFEPALCSAFASVMASEAQWQPLTDESLAARILQLEPVSTLLPVDEDYLDAVAKGFAMVIDSKSPFTAGHSQRVALYASVVAEEMGLPAARCRWLHRAALLHDIGKLAISNTILDKPGKLTDDEFATIKTHASLSAEILSVVPAFADMAGVAGSHHERLDGKGYPLGLTAEQLPLETRIVTVADIFDALTADRPYRAAMPLAKALSIMQGDCGKAIDAQCFAALQQALGRMRLPVAA